MKIELDLATIKRNKKIREEDNFRFRGYLKRHDTDKIDKIVHDLYAKVIEHVDCTECAIAVLNWKHVFKKKKFSVH